MIRNLLRPWLAPLLAHVTLCRGLVITAAVLGLAHLCGLNLLPCPFSTVTGLPCAGCGITRATAALLRGDLPLAIHYHPFSPGFFILGLLLTLSAIAPAPWRSMLVQKIEIIERRTLLPTLFVIAFFVYGILRMTGTIPSPPITNPSPVIEWLKSRQQQPGLQGPNP
ncbi:DUF2752 domain-containing protein [Phragmitibacter flavus]|uniref:DUF2752 domain-containing protein n=1 Tax=Phragmitibacter flavus TaxID=2576071 RepID=A0A5R8KGT2_9BACT|nr:DUF2752 domain-containing protein [Phragmitibacter flavus]TLD71502.1 DUF2752 domain-containing protein [Phragmitibacter flavus]